VQARTTSRSKKQIPAGDSNRRARTGGSKRVRDPSEEPEPRVPPSQPRKESIEWRIPRRNQGADRSAMAVSTTRGNMASTWDLMAALAVWPMEDRPEAMLNPDTVNAMSLETVFTFKEHYEQQVKKEGKGDMAFGRDKKIPDKMYAAQMDNCAGSLHEIRFERGPVVEIGDYWDRMPLKRVSTFRHLPLEHAGAANDVNECVITRAHDRTLPLRLRMFCKSNHSKKGFVNKDSEGKEPADSWEQPKGVLELQMALLQFMEVYASIWPLDPTPRLLAKLLVHYKYGEGISGGERDRCRHLEEFCDELLRESAGRANRGKTPLSYLQMKDRWRDFKERVGETGGSGGNNSRAGNSGPAGGSNQPNKGQQQNNNKNKGAGGKAPRGGQQARLDGMRVNGLLVCYHYNSKGRGCTRAPKDGGCEDSAGRLYAHVCNHESNGQLCQAKHPRHSNH
jgi:hypothetical protein